VKGKWLLVLILGLALLLAIQLSACATVPPPAPTPEEPGPTPTLTPEQPYEQYLDQGDVYLEQELWDEAIGEYNKAVELNPQIATAYANRAVAYYEGYKQSAWGECDWEYCLLFDDCDRALELDPLIKLDPRLADAYVQRGNCCLEPGNWEYDDAIAHYAKAIMIDPTIATNVNPRLAEAYYHRGDHNLEFANYYDDYDEVIRDFTKAMELDPTTEPWLITWLAEAYAQRGSWYLNESGMYPTAVEGYTEAIELAIEDYTKAIELNPDRADYYYCRGGAYDHLADYYWDAGQVSKQVDSNNKAISDYTRAIELAPERADYFSRGQCYAFNGDYVRAIADFTKAIELGREEWSVYFNRASAYKELGNKSEALADYKRALALAEDDFIKEQSLKYIEELQSD